MDTGRAFVKTAAVEKRERSRVPVLTIMGVLWTLGALLLRHLSFTALVVNRRHRTLSELGQKWEMPTGCVRACEMLETLQNCYLRYDFKVFSSCLALLSFMAETVAGPRPCIVCLGTAYTHSLHKQARKLARTHARTHSLSPSPSPSLSVSFVV